MKIHSFLLQISLVWSLCLACSAALPAGETNLEAAAVAAPAQVQIPSPEITELRQQLGEIEKSNKAASEKWEALAQQNSALSNVLTGLQQTLISQKEREIELAKQSSALHLRVILGAAAAVFIVFLFSYWFQLRCLNRVMEFSRSLPALPHAPALLENENPQTSRLLAAMKALESRIHQLEIPPAALPPSNGSVTEVVEPSHASSAAVTVSAAPAEPASGGPSSVTLLLSKGQMLLDMERLQEAVKCFQDALVIEPANAEAHFKKGIALERMSRLELALNCYDEALRLNPRRAIVYAYKARVLAGLHRYDEAISVYDSALGKNAPSPGPAMFTS